MLLSFSKRIWTKMVRPKHFHIVILVCGHRKFNDYKLMESSILKLIEKYEAKKVLIIHGAARGADTLAGFVGRNQGYWVDEYPANWRAFGKAAGYKRNTQMLEELIKVDCLHKCVLAFPHRKGKGTQQMMNLAENEGIEVHEHAS